MFSFTAAANDIFRCADPVADLDCGSYVFGPIGPPVIVNAYAYNVYPFAHSDKVRFTSLSPVSHSSSWKNVMYGILYCPFAKFEV